MSDTKQVPHSGPTIVSRHRTKFSRLGHMARCIYVTLVSALRVGQLCDVISPSLIAASRTPNRYVVNLLSFSESQPQTAHRYVQPCVSGCSFLPAFRNDTSQHLAVHHRRIFLQDTAVVQCPLVSRNVLSTNCAWPAVYSDCVCYVRSCGNLMALLCCCCGSTEGGANEGSKRNEVAVRL